jgi:hypothetical protein
MCELIAMIKRLGPDSLLHLLQRKRVSDDPDLLMEKDTQIKIDGLPTLADVNAANKNLNSGAMPFTEVMKPFELR